MTKQLRIVAFLARLPVGYRELALKNYHNRKHKFPRFSSYMSDAIMEGFSWDDTSEGSDFWDDVYRHYLDPDNELPPLP